MTEQLQLRNVHRVLEIGTGSGYQAAVLSRLVREVVTLERFRSLAERARARLTRLGYGNVEVLVGDGFSVPDEAGHFDRIMVTAAMESIPTILCGCWSPRGADRAGRPRAGSQMLVRLRQTPDGVERSDLIGVRFRPGTARDRQGDVAARRRSQIWPRKCFRPSLPHHCRFSASPGSEPSRSVNRAFALAVECLAFIAKMPPNLANFDVGRRG